MMYDPMHFALFGAQRSMLALAGGLRSKGFQPLIVTGREGVLSRAARERGLQVEIISIPESLDVFERRALHASLRERLAMSVHLLLYSAKIYRFVRRRKIGTLYANDLRSVLFLSVSKILSRRRLIWYIRGGPSFGMLSAIAAWLSDQIVLISNAAIKALPQWVQRPAGRKICVNYIGIDASAYGRAREAERVEIRRKYGLPESSILISSIGSVSPRKGFDTLLAALETVPGRDPALHVAIAGTPEGAGSEGYLPTLEKTVEEAQLPVTFLGWLDDVRGLLSASDIFVLASREEGLGRVILEAMAAYLPVVVTYAGGSEETVVDGVSGFIVQPEDPAELARVLRPLTRDAELRTRIGSQARIRCEQVFSVDAYVDRFAELLRTP